MKCSLLILTKRWSERYRNHTMHFFARMVSRPNGKQGSVPENSSQWNPGTQKVRNVRYGALSSTFFSKHVCSTTTALCVPSFRDRSRDLNQYSNSRKICGPFIKKTWDPGIMMKLHISFLEPVIDWKLTLTKEMTHKDEGGRFCARK